MLYLLLEWFFNIVIAVLPCTTRPDHGIINTFIIQYIHHMRVHDISVYIESTQVDPI